MWLKKLQHLQLNYLNNITNKQDIKLETKTEYRFKPLPCEHKKQGNDCDDKIKDFHPLSKNQIRELIDEAKYSEEPNIQLERLLQAVPGNECPRNKSGNSGIIYDMVTELFNKAIDGGLSNMEYLRLFGILGAVN